MSYSSFEQEVKRFLAEKQIAFEDNSASFARPDFVILADAKPYFYLEVKEKQRRYNMQNWPNFAPEADLFILDDLTVRKCLAYAPRSGVLVRDSGNRAYVFFSVIDLALMPRLRVNRPIQRQRARVKGKWLINLRNGAKANNLQNAFIAIRTYLATLDETVFTSLECYGDYVDEEISDGGMVRRPIHWEQDVQSTR